jgi:hypothetical protein
VFGGGSLGTGVLFGGRGDSGICVLVVMVGRGDSGICVSGGGEATFGVTLACHDAVCA